MRMIEGRLSLGIELTPRTWRAVYLQESLLGIRVIAQVAGDCRDPEEFADSARAALEESAERLDVPAGTRVGVALARPVVHVKQVELPNASNAEVRSAIHRDARRLFPVGEKEVVADFRRTERNGLLKTGVGTGITVAVPEPVVNAFAAACESLELELRSVEASSALVFRLLPRSAEVAVLGHDGGFEVGEYDGGGLHRSRYYPFASAVDGEFGVGDSLGLPGEHASDNRSLLYVGPEAFMAEVRRRTNGREVRVLRTDRVPGKRKGGPEDPTFLPAYAAATAALGDGRTFDLRPERHRAADAKAARRRSLVLAGCAVMAAFAFWLSGFYGLRWEVLAIEREAARLRPAVEEITEARATLERIAAVAAGMARLEASQPRWSLVLAELATLLPPDAYLIGLTQTPNALRIEGYARNAGAVATTLTDSKLIQAARLTGPVAKEATPVGERERFTLEVVLAEGGRRP